MTEYTLISVVGTYADDKMHVYNDDDNYVEDG